MKLTILIVLALGLGACGSSGTPGASDSSEQRALAFARCMRTHGVDVPDPKPGNNGIEFSFGGPGQRGGVTPARVDTAMQACRKLAPNGGHRPSAADRQKMEDQALAFSRCMRAHGVDFPDPKFSGDGARVSIGGPGSTFNPRSPAFQAAQKACQSLMPGPKGGGGTFRSGSGPAKGGAIAVAP
jgi:hypothetical protein